MCYKRLKMTPKKCKDGISSPAKPLKQWPPNIFSNSNMVGLGAGPDKLIDFFGQILSFPRTMGRFLFMFLKDSRFGGDTLFDR